MKFFRSGLLAILAVPTFSQAFLWTKTITFNDPNGLYTYSASADFTQSGDDLVIVFTNIATDPANFNRRVLTGVFWDLENDPNTTAVSAAITAGSSQINGGDPPANIGEHWAFKQNLAANPWGNAYYGIAAAGLGYFGPSNAFIPGMSPQGVDYGLVPTAGTTLGIPLVMDSMTFTMDLPDNYILTEDSISNVWFQYGSATEEFFFNVPEPTSMAVLGIGALALIARKRRKQ